MFYRRCGDTPTSGPNDDSVTRTGYLLDFGQLFKAFVKN